MNELTKQAGFLKGLLEGVEEKTPKEQRLLEGIVNLLGGLADRLDAVEELMEDLNDYVESIDDDLTGLENDFDKNGMSVGGMHFEDDEPFGMGADIVPMFGGMAEAKEKPKFVCVCKACKGCFCVEGTTKGKKYKCPNCGEIVPYAELDIDDLTVVKAEKKSPRND